MTPSYRTSTYILSHFSYPGKKPVSSQSLLNFQKPIQHFSPSWRTPITVPLCRSSTVILIVELKCLTTVVAGVQDATG